MWKNSFQAVLKSSDPEPWRIDGLWTVGENSKKVKSLTFLEAL